MFCSAINCISHLLCSTKFWRSLKSQSLDLLKNTTCKSLWTLTVDRGLHRMGGNLQWHKQPQDGFYFRSKQRSLKVCSGYNLKPGQFLLCVEKRMCALKTQPQQLLHTTGSALSLFYLPSSSKTLALKAIATLHRPLPCQLCNLGSAGMVWDGETRSCLFIFWRSFIFCFFPSKLPAQQVH